MVPMNIYIDGSIHGTYEHMYTFQSQLPNDQTPKFGLTKPILRLLLDAYMRKVQTIQYSTSL